MPTEELRKKISALVSVKDSISAMVRNVKRFSTGSSGFNKFKATTAGAAMLNRHTSRKIVKHMTSVRHHMEEAAEQAAAAEREADKLKPHVIAVDSLPVSALKAANGEELNEHDANAAIGHIFDGVPRAVAA
eukprot:SAG31_NODE_1003_length_10447_cov_3.491593_3_plen_132_part_00